MKTEKMGFDISDSELYVMRELWDQPGVSTKVISFNLYQKFDWAPGTTYTILLRCVKKGLAKKDGRGCWAPAVSRSTVRDMRMQTVKDQLYDGSYTEMACAMLRDTGFTAEEFARLQEAVAHGEQAARK